ncbi:RING finger protein 17 isoform X2 [Cotesia glomerata]|uniref:Tudor domain-containing protein n=2 Tax=Cotesia glomerata TaxID=32391 RepID=A0AAV7IXA1_COTGL|nr:RING finger protein 17 isoform X2 [Cotesia glomerata]KAH0560638.1 hypothetical protein KQX54_006615 [Cotesia glomerata]
MKEDDHSTEEIEVEISKSFVHIHGVLQLLEERMMQVVYEERRKERTQVEEIDNSLQVLKEQIESAIVTAVFAKKHSENVSHQMIIDEFKELLKLPCHLVEPQYLAKQSNLKFQINSEEIIETIKNNCDIIMSPSNDSYKLVCIDELQNDQITDKSENLSQIPPILFQKQTEKSPEVSPPSSETSGSSGRQSLTLNSESESSVIESDTSAMHSVEGSAKSIRTTEKQIRNGIEVTITHIDNPNAFYIRATMNDGKFRELEKKLEKYNEVNTQVPRKIVEGGLYVIHRSGNPRWYRGRIMGSKSAEGPVFYPVYQVFAIDHGFTDVEIGIANIRNLFEDLLDIPPLVQKFSLYDISPIGESWCRDSVAHMEEIIDSAERAPILYTTKQGGKDLLIPVSPTTFPLSLRDALIFLGYGKFISTARLYRINPSASNVFHHDHLAPDQLFDAVYLNSYSPECIYVRKASYNEHYFENMVQKMTEDYKSTKRIKGYIYCPETGMNVAVPHENSWYRGVIVDIVQVRVIEVLLVDLGINTTIDYKKIRRLDSRYSQSTVRAIKLSLKDAKPLDPAEGWSPETNAAIKQFMNPINIQVVIYDSVTIDGFLHHTASIINKNRLSLALYLQYLKISAQTVSTGVLEKMQSRFKSIQSKKKSFKRRKSSKKPKNQLPKLEDPYKVQVMISLVKSPFEIYVTSVHESTAINDIVKKMQRFYETHSTDEQVKLVEDTVCAVYSKDHNCYYRAKIKKVISSEEVIVFLIDYGETAQVAASDLLSLGAELYDIPIHVFKVKLAGIAPCGGSESWIASSIQSLQELLDQNGDFFISKVAESEDDAMLVDMFFQQSIVDDPCAPARSETWTINRELVDKGYALPIKGFNDRKLKVLASDLHEEMNFSSCDLSKLGTSNESSEESEGGENDEDPEEETKSQDSEKTLKDEKEGEENPEFKDVPFPNFAAFPSDIPQWLPAEPIELSEPFNALVTDINWDGYLHLVPIKNNCDTIRWIENTLNEKFRDSTWKKETWNIGDMCIAKFQDTWSRALVHRVQEKIAIEYIDYGNMMWQDEKFLRKELLLENVPRQATKCKVYEMIPDTPNTIWRQEDLDKLHVLLVDKVCQVTIVSQSPEVLVIIELLEPKCNLITYLTENFIVKLKKVMSDDVMLNGKNYKIKYGGQLEKLEDEDDSESENSDDVIIEIEDMTDLDLQSMEIEANLEAENYHENNDDLPENDLSILIMKELGLTNGDFIPSEGSNYPIFTLPVEVRSFEAVMGHVDTSKPNIVYLHPISSKDHPAFQYFKKKYDAMMYSIGFNIGDCSTLPFFEIGDPCLAVYSKDNAWYRCTIMTDRGSDGLTQVEFIDWGSVEWKSKEEIRKIPKDWMKVPRMAIKCRLWNTRITDNSSGAVDWLHKACEKVKFNVQVMKRENGCTVVQIYDMKNPQRLFYQPLIDRRVFEAELKDIY